MRATHSPLQVSLFRIFPRSRPCSALRHLSWLLSDEENSLGKFECHPSTLPLWHPPIPVFYPQSVSIHFFVPLLYTSVWHAISGSENLLAKFERHYSVYEAISGELDLNLWRPSPGSPIPITSSITPSACSTPQFSSLGSRKPARYPPPQVSECPSPL